MIKNIVQRHTFVCKRCLMFNVKVTVQIRAIIQFEMHKIIKGTNFKYVYSKKNSVSLI